VDDTKITDVNAPLTAKEFVLHKGKKVHLKVIVSKLMRKVDLWGNQS